MYNNRILLICFLIIATSVSNHTCARLVSNSKYGVCSGLSRLLSSGSKNDLPDKKPKQIKGEWIKLNNSTASKLVKAKLEELGIESEVLRNIEDENERREVIESIVNFINSVYKEAGYFNSQVRSWNYLDSGELRIECVEKSIPEYNFRLFIKDEKSNNEVSIRSEDVIKASTDVIPSGKYTQLSNEYLVEKIFRNGRICKLDRECFEAIRRAELYKNLEFVLHRDKNEIYLDFFFDDYGTVHSLSPTISVQQGGPVLNLVYRNRNLAGTRALLHLAAELNVLRLLKYNHKLKLNLFSDALDFLFWSTDAADCTLVNFYGAVSMNDVAGLCRAVGRLRLLDRFKFSLRSRDAKTKLEALKERVSNVRSLRETALSSFKPERIEPAQVELRDSELCLRLMKKLGNLKYVFAPSLGSSELCLSNQLSYRFSAAGLPEPAEVDASLTNIYRYRVEVSGDESTDETTYKNTTDSSTKKTTTDSSNASTTDKTPFKYRAEARLALALPSRCRLLCRCLLANRMRRGDYRGLSERLLGRRFLLAALDVAAPLTFRFRLVPYVGLFLDLLLPSARPAELGLSLGVRFTVLNLTVSVPLLSRLDSGFVFNTFSKGAQSYHLGL